MGRISLIEKPTAACNAILFDRLPDPRGRYRYLVRTITRHDIRHLKALAYKAFVQTLYWRVVREYVFSVRGRACSAPGCTATKGLELHHRDYRYQGEEFRALDCLAIQCRAHHESGHLKAKAKSITEKLNMRLVSLSHQAAPVPRPKRNLLYNPRIMMNLKVYGDIRGYQEDKNGTA